MPDTHQLRPEELFLPAFLSVARNVSIPGWKRLGMRFLILSSSQTKQTFVERIICRISQKTDTETKKREQW